MFTAGGFSADEVAERVEVSGPRSWWAGPLDVEALAVSSIRVALAAGAEVARRRGLRLRLGSTAERVAANLGSYLHLRVDGRPLRAFAEYSGFFETADGWIRLHGNYPHHARVLERELGVADRSGLAAALRRLPSVETEGRIRAAGGIAGALRTPEQWRATAMAAAVARDPWVAWGPPAEDGPPGAGPDAVPPAARRRLAPATDGPLSGIRVLDLTRVIAGPHGSRLLALLGADVLRVDPPQLPELLDQHLDSGAGKRSAIADLRDPSELARAHELLAAADVLLTGYRPAALATFGLDGAAVRERHPHLVHVSLSAWGVHGPWGADRGFDSIVQACTGIGSVYGQVSDDGRERPGALPVQALDLATGYGVAAAAMALLAVRPERGGGAARLCLARTAQALLDAPTPAGALPCELDVPLGETDSPHGRLVHVTGPVLRDGTALSLAPPGEYAAADLAWLP